MGFEVLFKGSNMVRLLGGLLVALKISLISVVISIILGIIVGMLMTMNNRIINAITRVYLEIVRIMPQLVLLFIVYFGATRALGINISAEAASIIVFSFWGTAEMADLVRGALISIPTIQYESSKALGLTTLQTYIYYHSPDHQKNDTSVDQPDNQNDQDNQSCHDDRNCGGTEGRSADNRGK